ncbi:MAG: mechanosensitive ion channel [Candidatus Pacebacteria bacterium]|nr:mechanosensitive ion channel [Candidatus Paceibacterota bacterium]
MDLNFIKLLSSFLTLALRVAVVLLIAFLANRLAKVLIQKMTGHLVRAHDGAHNVRVVVDEQRLLTLKKAFTSIFSTIIWLIATITLLSQIGINITPILAALGVGGLALGLAAQNIIRDYLSGVMILLEDQFRVSEEIEIAGRRGQVEDFNLRRVVLKTKTGEMCFVPNSQINSVVNLTRGLKYRPSKAVKQAKRQG